MQETTGSGVETRLAKEAAHEWVKENAARTVLAAAVPMPIPLGHSLLTTAIEAYMIIQIAAIYGHRISLKEAIALIPVLGATMGVGKLAALAAGELLTYVPVAGWIAKGGVGAGIAYLIGKKATAYFEDRNPGKIAAPFEITLSLKDIISSIVSDNISDSVGKTGAAKADEHQSDESNASNDTPDSDDDYEAEDSGDIDVDFD